MKLKDINFFICLCLCVNVAYAKDVKYPLDTIALGEALNEIRHTSRVAREKIDQFDWETREAYLSNARAAFYNWFVQNSKNGIYAKDIANKCVEIVGDAQSCINFLQTYNLYLDHANFCITANNFKIVNYHDSPNGRHDFAYRDCSSRAVYTGDYGNTSLVDECKQWDRFAKACAMYLKKYYEKKLSNSKISESDKMYYECLLEKLETGNIDFPMSKMEADCK